MSIQGTWSDALIIQADPFHVRENVCKLEDKTMEI